MTDLFPHGLDRVQQATAWSVVAHNRYWSASTPYAIQNGGPFHFIMGKISRMTMFYKKFESERGPVIFLFPIP